MSKRKTVIIGAGHVGAHVASALMMQDICEEIILLDTDAQKAWSHAVDLQDTACYAGKNTTVRSGGYEELRDADICVRSEEHTSELQSLGMISYAVFCLKKKKKK